MSTVVVHRPTGKRYLLLGTGYGVWGALGGPSARPVALGAAEGRVESKPWSAVRKSTGPHPALGKGAGERLVATVCDESGTLVSFDQHELEVLSVNGKPPQHYLTSSEYR